ncbi:unnamed protein product, partial [Ectocarpus sp. 4 AP-2014]
LQYHVLLYYSKLPRGTNDAECSRQWWGFVVAPHALLKAVRHDGGRQIGGREDSRLGEEAQVQRRTGAEIIPRWEIGRCSSTNVAQRLRSMDNTYVEHRPDGEESCSSGSSLPKTPRELERYYKHGQPTDIG